MPAQETPVVVTHAELTDYFTRVRTPPFSDGPPGWDTMTPTEQAKFDADHLWHDLINRPLPG